MEQYLIDNNVISGYFSELFSMKGMDFIAEIIDQTANISIITEIEALSWINPNKTKEQIIKEFIQTTNILILSPSIVSQCVKIRRSRKIKTPDAIIAATAIVHNYTLITGDGGFTNIQGLKVINPYSL